MRIKPRCTSLWCSWQLYWASVEYRNWYCSVVWIMPPLQRGEEGGVGGPTKSEVWS